MDFPWHFPMDCQCDFPTEVHLSVVCSKGLSLFQWISTGIVQQMFTCIVRRNLAFVISGVIFCPECRGLRLQGHQTMRARSRRCPCRCPRPPRKATPTCSGPGVRHREGGGTPLRRPIFRRSSLHSADARPGGEGRGRRESTEGRGAEGRGGPR